MNKNPEKQNTEAQNKQDKKTAKQSKQKGNQANG